ncbi:ABC transporter permease [Acetivibrio saccincola]|jgi:ABC-type transport system involved in multi-copper enzyme maturation permease subunit|uniref:ABC-2 family transporter protein n=1 Tax=Acetivibrio saccincola TaxID=1677857 RepID=A0A2K9ECA9_9FIRM|nr:ABC transporter permease subunit [Acetivibrio saccincola]AUG57764.1 ABC-2 family transporter protein [Acetivibrio saccincola]
MQINPVIEKELKTKMRGWRAPALITAYLGFLFFVVFIYFLIYQENRRYGSQVLIPEIVVSLYNTIAFIQLLLILFITPIITGGAISSERERQTLDLLLCTDFSALKIIIGKIFVSIAHIMLLVTASFPILGIVFLYGGVRIWDVILLFIFYIIIAVMTASIGVFYSTVFKKSIVSIVMTYLTLGFFIVGTAIALLIYSELILDYLYRLNWYDIMFFLTPNPFYGFGIVIEDTLTDYGLLALFVEAAIYRGGVPVITALGANSIFNIALSICLIMLSARRLRRLK